MDDRSIEVSGSLPIRAVLKDDPIFRLLGERLATPTIAGAVLACMIFAIILFGSTGSSRFIYTDF